MACNAKTTSAQVLIFILFLCCSNCKKKKEPQWRKHLHAQKAIASFFPVYDNFQLTLKTIINKNTYLKKNFVLFEAAILPRLPQDWKLPSGILVS